MPDDNSQAPVHEGDIIAGKYVVERVLGVGGMGVVVAARHVELGELFALKFLLPSVRANAEVTRRFAREARTGIRVKNEHVARVLDVGTLPDGAPYMVMEHLTGEDLSTVIERRGHLPVTEAVDLLLQACEALCEAHQMGIVHRDLKPANLFVIAGSDGLPFVKVLDFGISKHVGAGDDLSVTSTDAVMGSPLYMSPEQLLSSKDVDRRSDIWSLGVILYEAVSGATPFDGVSYAAVCAAVLGGKFEPASSLRSGIPPQLDKIIASMLRTNRDARLSSVEVLARQLAPLGTAQARTSSERIARIAARPTAGSGDADASRPNAALTAAAATPLAETHQIETGSGSRRRSRILVPVALATLAVGAIGGWALLRAGGAVRTGTPAPQVSASAPPPVVAVVVSAPSSNTSSLPSTDPSGTASASTGAASPPPPDAAAHERAPTASARPATGPRVSTADALTRAFAHREADVARCFDAQGPDMPGAPTLAIRFTVDVDGHVKSAQVFPPEVASTPLGECLAGVARGTQFGPQTEEMSFRIPIRARRGS